MLAQQSASQNAAPRIDGFDVVPTAKPVAGSELVFTLYGSPAGTATVRIGGATGSLILEEIEAGVYEGIYTITRRDQITEDSTATANLRRGNQVASSVLDESLVKGSGFRWPGGSAAANSVPEINLFNVDPPRSLTPGSELVFALEGSPSGNASVRINGVRGKINLEEVRAGAYEGAYTIRNRDRIATNAVVTGNLRIGQQEHSKVLGKPLVDSSSARQRTTGRQAAAPAPAARQICPNCGVVEAINVVEVKGDGSYIGMIGGGVVGALLGSQVGHGTGTTVAQIAGAAGGAWAGNEIEKKMKSTKHFDLVVRLENGGSQTVSYPAQPAFSVGSRVRIENGALVAI
ncbi:MAG: glycine zipper 2TM domain-containing protein [Burkholderiales bacterium]